MKTAAQRNADLNRLSLEELFAALVSPDDLQRLADAMAAEDAPPPGDITSASITSADQRGEAAVVSRGPGVVAGIEVVHQLLPLMRGPAFDWTVQDGDRIANGERLGGVNAKLRAILLFERPVLNMLGWLSGIATLTRRYVDAVAGTRAVICDTRKTTPGLRGLEKYAVRCGGGTLQRLGLHDAVLYKDNHLAHVPVKDLAATLIEAIEVARRASQPRFIEVEVDTIQQVERVLAIPAGMVDMMLLDNMAPDLLRKVVALRDRMQSKVLLEASGGVNLDNVAAIAATGVERISVGAITHSAPWLDIGLDIEAARS